VNQPFSGIQYIEARFEGDQARESFDQAFLFGIFRPPSLLSLPVKCWTRENIMWQLVSENSSSMKRVSEMLVDRLPGNLSENVLESSMLQISARNDLQRR
jgi:hypothetical protein